MTPFRSTLCLKWFIGVVVKNRCALPMHRWLQRMLVLLVLCSATACSLPTDSNDNFITEKVWTEDRTGQMQIDQVKLLDMRPWEGLLTLGYGHGTVWMRLRIDPSLGNANPEDMLYLRVRPNYLDEVVLIDPLQVPPEQAAIGDRHPLSAQREPSTLLMFEVPAGTGQRDIWLRVNTTSTRMINLEVMNENTMRLSNARISHASAIYLGLMVMFVLWGGVQMIMHPDRLIASFLIYQCLSIIFGIGLIGYTRFYAPSWLEPKWVDLTTSLSGIIATASVITFSKYVMKDLIDKIWEIYLDAIIFIVFPLLVIAVFIGEIRFGLMGNMAMILIMPPILLMIAAISRKETDKPSSPNHSLPKSLIISYLSSTLVLTFLTATPSLGLIKGSEISLYIINFYSIASGMLMLVILNYRNILIEKQRSELLIETQRQRSLANHERIQREEREQLLNMLGHELKTPLSAIRMMLGDNKIPLETSKKMSSAVTDMSQVIERTIQTGLLEDGGITPRLEICQPFAIFEDICRNIKDDHLIQLEISLRSDVNMEAASDPFILLIIFRNMLDNAVKYGKVDSRIKIDCWSSNITNTWHVSICNLPGQSGWPDPQLIFTKYYRSPNANHKTGSGLGLYLVKGLCHKLGGEMSYKPKNESVCFQLSMPRQTKEAA